MARKKVKPIIRKGFKIGDLFILRAKPGKKGKYVYVKVGKKYRKYSLNMLPKGIHLKFDKDPDKAGRGKGIYWLRWKHGYHSARYNTTLYFAKRNESKDKQIIAKTKVLVPSPFGDVNRRIKI